MRFEDRLTQSAKTAIELSQQFAAEFGHNYVGSEHLLLGLIKEGTGVAAKVLRDNGIDEQMVRELIERRSGMGHGGEIPPQGLTPRAKRAIEIAAAESTQMGHNYIGSEHLLMGLVREYNCAAAEILRLTGADLNKIYTDIINIFKSEDHKQRKAATVGKSGKKNETKTLDEFSRDLTEAARLGKLDPVIGRDKEIERVMQILSRRSKNNPVLIGEPGVGKTAIAEGLAQKVVSGDIPENLKDKRIVSLDLTGMVAGTKYRGDFEERIKNAIEEAKNDGSIILFIDELHTIIGAGAAEGAIDAANIIKPMLGRAEIQIIGATTINEYRKYIEKDAALERRFQPVTVNEPSQEDTVAILKGLRDKYEAHHDLKITDEALEAAVTMSARYINDRYLPDKAIDLMDEAASRVRMERHRMPDDVRELEMKKAALTNEKEAAIERQDFEAAAKLRDQEREANEILENAKRCWNMAGRGENVQVEPEDIAKVVSGWTGIPVTSITQDESERLLKMEEILHKRVIGQDEAVTAVAKAIRRGRVGLKDPKRPIGSFLFMGPTGVGKTELCKALAEAMFGDENAMIRVDMSEYMEKHTVSKLIGSPPGYVGFDEGGQLTEKIRRKPYSVVLFDEIEKAHEDVFNIMLQILDDGILTDSQGRRVDFKNTVIVMTSNVGARNLTEKQTKLGFRSEEKGDEVKDLEEIKQAVMGDLRRTFKPEFLNRIDDIIVFRQLTREDIKKISANMLRTVAKRMADMGITLTAEDAAVELLADKGFDPVYGARPLRRAIQNMVEDEAAEKMLSGEIREGDSVTAKAVDGKILLETTRKTDD